MGVVHGVKAFLPLLRSHGEGGHIVNTASMAGFLPFGFGAYCATKFALVGISEALAMELEPQGIGVSVLCPGWVATHITESRRNWQAPQSKDVLDELLMAAASKSDLDPDKALLVRAANEICAIDDGIRPLGIDI